MGPGKLAAQAGHAFVEALLQALSPTSPSATREAATRYVSDPPGTKVVLSVRNLDELLWAQENALSRGIPCSLIEDSGHVLLPHFDGGPVLTALGFGPATREEVDFLTKRFALVK